MTKFSTSPYPGLRAFRADESDIFFGREEQTDCLLARLQRSHFLAVVGPSGCGKSSLVRAGMIAALETGFMTEAGSSWRIAEMRPGEKPISRLTQALSTPQALGPERVASAEEAVFLEAALRRGPLGLNEVLHETPLPAQTNLLLLVDQFEEIFRFREKGDPDEADAFVALLLATAQQRETQVYVVITMRSDFLGDCMLFKGLPEAINESQYLTPRLIREQCRAAIVGPARVCGGDLESALVNRLLNDFGPDADQLPLLQHALMRMWTRVPDRVSASGESVNETLRAVSPIHVMLAVRDYEELGGLSRALSDHADEVLKELTDPQRRIAEIMFRRLTERGVGKRDTRAPAPLSDVAAVAAVSETDLTAVVEAFRRPDRCFVSPPVGMDLGPDTLLDIGHESLIRQWSLLGEWVEEEGRSALMYRRLNQTAQLWKAGDAAVWRNPDLERALKWKHAQNPSSAWAIRYSSAEEFELAMEFLRESEHAWSEELRLQKERERQAERLRSRKQRMRLAILGTASVVLLLAAVVFAILYQKAEAERARMAIKVWKVGSPHTGDIPSITVPPDLESEASKIGRKLRVKAFPAKGFAEKFLEAFEKHEAPDILTIDNYGIITGISTARGKFEGINKDQRVAQSLIMVTGSLKSFEGAQGGWEFLIATSRNHEVCKSLALRPPDCDASGMKSLKSLTGDLEQIAARIGSAYFESAEAALQPYEDNAYLSTEAVVQGDVQIGVIRTCGYWGNDRLAFVPVLFSFQKKGAIGRATVLLVLRKQLSQWKLLTATIDPISTGQFMGNIPKLANLLNEQWTPEDKPIPAKLLAPEEGQLPQPTAGQRFGDFSWQPSTSTNVVAEIIEFAYTAAILGMPSNNEARLFIRFRSGNSPVKDQISAGQLWTTGSLWQWRIWSISDAGVVSLSESRSFAN